MIRTFLALPVPLPVVHTLTVAQHRLPLSRPVPEENFHVTLVFLDSQPEPLLEELHYALDGLSLTAPTLRIDGLGTFGGNDPDALYARIAPDPVLTALQAKLAQTARRIGIAVKARKFVPHITLARFRKGEMLPGTLASAIGALGPLTSPPWTPPELILTRSTLRADGPVYDPLASYPFRF
ncbi:RNA 2',3'-cyclic phosphodiesterase [Pararhodobacter zhoushanensis]|uniref:RNA 2',3'-cyclic phosphodiesterase n=1 Tax=Pararhodobacter zhoushanensis TaxID=2479545 RepID=A0ABT3GW66_9RHOB|nr:RNA 2',3'-cyclic phosphodiesterase [Pararhodobacter zhoushanensis]MCW1931789.1 RNA 2',3'-cyclic phosphodiesterase [Pararhodobacter zhoushanensis]